MNDELLEKLQRLVTTSQQDSRIITAEDGLTAGDIRDLLENRQQAPQPPHRGLPGWL